MKKIFASIFIIALLMGLTSCSSNVSNDKSEDEPSLPPDLSGQWKQVNAESENSYYGAIIDDDVIEIYLVSDNGDTRSLYWAGSYTAPNTAEYPYFWESQNDKAKTEFALFASGDDTKTFTYKDGQISYSASMMGTTSKVRLEKQEWDPTLTIQRNDNEESSNNISSEKENEFDETNRFTFSHGGIECAIPLYYEFDRETSTDDKVYFDSNKGDFVILAFLAADATEEEYHEAFEDSFFDELALEAANFDNPKINDSSDIPFAGSIGKRVTVVGNYGNISATARMSMGYNSANQKLLLILLIQGGTPQYNYLEDYDRIVASAKLIEPEERDSSFSPISGIRTEFKEAMDSYEAFFDEYITFMNNFSNSDNTLDALSAYADFMSRYSEAMEGMEALGEEEMSTEETAYYLEVTNRINQKLLSALS